MEKFVQLKELAKRIDATEAVAEYESRCASIENREHIGVVITGGSNCGKTTILNGITGVLLRETSSIPDEEPPLRVTFERMADLEGFDCRTVLNKHWNSEGAILYEMKRSDIIDDAGYQKKMLDLVDVVFYVISALTPFTREDMDTIKSLLPLRVQVVLNQMDMIHDEDRPKVEEYVAGICAKLGIDVPLVVQADDWDAMAKLFRSVLPISSELTLLRRNYVNALYHEAVTTVMEEAQQQTNRLDADAEAILMKQTEDEMELQQKRAEWKVLKAEMLEMGASHCCALRDTIMAREAAVTENLLATGKTSGFSEKWFENELSKQMCYELNTIVEENIPKVESFMRSDCEEMIRRAIQQGLTTADACYRVDFEPLTKIGIDYEHTVQLHETIQKGSAQTVRADKVTANVMLLIGTAAACSLVYLIKPSVLLTFVSAGIGGVVIGIEEQSRKTVEWSKALNYYTNRNLCNLSDAMDKAIRKYYDILAETMAKKIDELSVVQMSGDRDRQEEKILTEVIHQCQMLLQNK